MCMYSLLLLLLWHYYTAERNTPLCERWNGSTQDGGMSKCFSTSLSLSCQTMETCTTSPPRNGRTWRGRRGGGYKHASHLFSSLFVIPQCEQMTLCRGNDKTVLWKQNPEQWKTLWNSHQKVDPTLQQRLGEKQQHHLIIIIQQQVIVCLRDLQDGLVQTGEHELPLGAVSQVVADHLNTGKSN